VKGNAGLNSRYRAIAMTNACHQCIHYYVTWDQYFPHGCRAMDFKSKRMPIQDVRMAMRLNDCLTFELKRRKRHHQEHSIPNKP
jgi:hypothetical protein